MPWGAGVHEFTPANHGEPHRPRPKCTHPGHRDGGAGGGRWRCCTGGSRRANAYLRCRQGIRHAGLRRGLGPAGGHAACRPEYPQSPERYRPTNAQHPAMPSPSASASASRRSAGARPWGRAQAAQDRPQEEPGLGTFTPVAFGLVRKRRPRPRNGWQAAGQTSPFARVSRPSAPCLEVADYPPVFLEVPQLRLIWGPSYGWLA